MKEEFPKKVAQFVSKNEITILFCLFVFVGLKYIHFPGRSIITIVGLQSIAGIYFISGIIPQKEGEQNSILVKLQGISSGVILVGTLFGFMHWPGWRMMVIVGSTVIIGLLIYGNISKKDEPVKKESQLRLIILLVLGLTLYFFQKPSNNELYRNMMTDFNIERVYEEKEAPSEPNQQTLSEYLHMMNVNFLTEEEHINYGENTEELNAWDAYFIISQPKFNDENSSAEFHLTKQCGKGCSFTGDYIYTIEKRHWQQSSQKNISEW